ncbi:substrate-binding domain-containing protein [Paracraurococcus lichenis]|uniref:Substrate-binding domain-containing protein n=1 Tax=Paracraurococcus lichenis TaxID=3064888 RepID=A0ABT9DS48_9PROT|nr:substrate-binding domain-containing protein [Paracraurococcus sp. LOR1-02]MDO9706726.1 substrate-binding domain-containing protein [Paracraurococcus sp. LOR1-02]
MEGDTLTILSTLGVMEAMRALGPGFEAEAGLRLAADYAPTKSLLGRIAAGEAADLAFLTADAVDDLMASGTLRPGSRTDLARSFVGVAVRAGAPRPDIASAEAFVRTLLAAKSIAYSRAGASGIFFAGLIKRLGIEAEVNAKATIIPEGLTGALAARGEAEIAIQQVSELMAVPGIDILGRLPGEIAGITTFSGAIFAATARAEQARALLAFLTRPAHRAVFAEGGLEPVF